MVKIGLKVYIQYMGRVADVQNRDGLDGAFDLPFGSAEQLLQRAINETYKNHDKEQKHGDDRARNVRMGRSEPGESDGGDVFTHAERGVRERFGRGCDGGACGGFTTV